MLFRACFQFIFHRFLNRNFDVWEFQIKVFAGKVLHIFFIHGNRFLMDFEVDYGGPWKLFSGVLGLENKFENRGIFVMLTDPETLNWRGESTGYLGPLKR